jgi:hypothetical protein
MRVVLALLVACILFPSVIPAKPHSSKTQYVHSKSHKVSKHKTQKHSS